MHFFISYCRVVLSFATDEAQSQFDPASICKYGGFNPEQQKLCMQMPQSLLAVEETYTIFAEECETQFQNERWNCSGTAPPLVGDTPQELKRGTTVMQEFVFTNNSSEVIEIC